MEIIGWVALVVLLGWATLGIIIIAFNSLGKYNIGGVINSPRSKFIALIDIILIVYLWYLLILAAPFTIVIS